MGGSPKFANSCLGVVRTCSAPIENMLLEVKGARSRSQKGGRCKRSNPTNPQTTIPNGKAGLSPLEIRQTWVGDQTQTVFKETVKSVQIRVTSARSRSQNV